MFADLWIPAFAGMTGDVSEKRDVRNESRAQSASWERGAWFRLFADLWIPAFAGMTGEKGR